MLKIENLTKSFSGRPVLCGVNLQNDGLAVIMGESGCGKTTLLRILMGLETADSGRIFGVGRIAAVFQESRLVPGLTAADNLCLVSEGLSHERAETELKALGFEAADLKLPCSRLSGGQQRRTALLRALLCTGADTLLLDEPFTGMDEALIDRAAETIQRLRGARNALLVTHDRRAAALLGCPLYILEKGVLRNE